MLTFIVRVPNMAEARFSFLGEGGRSHHFCLGLPSASSLFILLLPRTDLSTFANLDLVEVKVTKQEEKALILAKLLKS